MKTDAVIKANFVIAVLVLASFFALRLADLSAAGLWSLGAPPEIIIPLIRYDPALAVRIGNYYFNIYKNGVYDLERAERYYQRALVMNPELIEPRYQLSRIAFLRADFSKALSLVDEVMVRDPAFKRAYYLRGLIHGYAGQLGAAAADFREFLEWDPKSWAGHNDLAWIYFRQGDYAQAEQISRTGLEKEPGNAWLLTSLGVALLNQGHKSEARDILVEAGQASQRLTEADWQAAYPGNDPRNSSQGIEAMRRAIQSNLEIAER